MDRRLTNRRQVGLPGISISGTALKWIGFILICLSSFSAAVIQRGIMGFDADVTAEIMYQAMSPEGGMMGPGTAAVICSLMSVMALPIYVHLLCEGQRHTKDVKLYVIRLLVCALVSEIPYDFAMSGQWFDFSVQNPLWAMGLGVIMIEICQMWKGKPGAGSIAIRVVVVVAAIIWALLLRVHMGALLILLITLFHFARQNKLAFYILGIGLTSLQFPAPIGLLFVSWHDGTPTRGPRWLFYVLYPVQLLLFGAWAVYVASGMWK